MFGSAKYDLHGSAQAPAGYTSPHDDWLAGVLYPGHGRAWPVPHPRISRGGLPPLLIARPVLTAIGGCTGSGIALKHPPEESKRSNTDFHRLRARIFTD
jgi:hypothetical protein